MVVKRPFPGPESANKQIIRTLVNSKFPRLEMVETQMILKFANIKFRGRKGRNIKPLKIHFFHSGNVQKPSFALGCEKCFSGTGISRLPFLVKSTFPDAEMVKTQIISNSRK